MHVGRKFKLLEYIQWTRREIVLLTVWATIPTLAYAVLGWRFLSAPPSVIAVMGTAVSFIIAFKNVECHRRASDALAIWTSIAARSMAWGNAVIGVVLPDDPQETRRVRRLLFNQHFAWLTALRYQLREPKVWENLNEPGNKEYMAFYTIPERKTDIRDALAKYLTEPTLSSVLHYRGDKANYLMSLQYRFIFDAYDKKVLDFGPIFMGMQGGLNELTLLQGNAQRIKSYPYARNFYSISVVLLRIFIIMVPFALLEQFHGAGRYAGLEAWTVWANIPFSVILTWIFVTLEKVGENSSNPFEGGVNDVPISTLAMSIEIEMRRMLGDEEADLPAAPANATVIL
ncbi:MAG: multidrug transporter [Alphaproteobacteria bacterium]|nr:multidrug transporter [Alphaproteobacteria bacterium]